MKYDSKLSGDRCCFGHKTRLDAKVPQHEIASVYDALSRFYDLWGSLTESRARNRALELAEIINDQDILEVAVGTGLAFYEIVKRNPNGTNIGIDISDGMLQKARKRLSRLSGSGYKLKLESAFDIQAADAQFDLIMNNYMFDLISFDEMDIVLKEFKRVLKKDGKLVLVNMTVGEKFGSGIYDLMYRISPKMMGGCRGIRLSEKLSQNGFRIKSREYYQQLLFPSEVILAQK